MRKLVLAACGVCAWLSLAGPARAQDDECRAIIAKAIKAAGGEDKLAALKATQTKAKGTLSAMGQDLEFTGDFFKQQPDRLKIAADLTINNQNVQITQVINGDKGWAHVMGNTMDLDADTIKMAKDELYVERVANLVTLKDKEFKLSPLGEVKVGDRQTVGVLVTRKDQRDVSLYFDSKTHELVKTESRMFDQFAKQEVNQEKLFYDYKEFIPGLRTPSRIVVNNDGKRFIEMTVSEMTAAERHDDSIYARP